jgi:RimJ/RimL family protein N-acetyltransferase
VPELPSGMYMTGRRAARSLASRCLMWRYAGTPRIRYERISLQGDGITLRAFSPEDLPRLLSIVQDPGIVRFSHLPSAWRTEEGALDYIRSLPRLAARGRRVDLAIEALRPGSLLGHVALRSISWSRRRAAVATWLAPEARKHGIATKALRLMCDWAFSELGLLRLEADPDRDNLAAQRMLERAGFAPGRTVSLGGAESRTVVMYGRARNSNGA